MLNGVTTEALLPNKNRYGLYGFLFLLLLLLHRLYYISLERFDLYVDEAQYWTWAQALDWGYYSKPPMVAWAIAATTSLCGDGEFCVKLASPLAYFVTSLVIYLTGKELFSARVAFFSAIVFATLPAVTLSSTLISTDPFLLLFWAVAFYAFLKAIRTNAWHWWLACGAACGLGLLSKYNFAIFAPSALLFMATSPQYRPQLKSMKPYAAALLAGLFYLPNFLWNLDNGFVSYLHTRDNANLSGPLFHPEEMLNFVGAQFLVFGPLLFGTLLWVTARIRELWKNEKPRLLFSFLLPFFAVILSISLLSRAHANWAAPMYISATILVVAWLVEAKKTWVIHASIILHLLLAGGLYNYHALARMAGIELSYSQDPFRRIEGWRALAEAMAPVRNAHPGTTLLVDNRTMAAEMLYYATPKPVEVVKWNADGVIEDHYELTTHMEGREGQDFLYPTQEKNPTEILSRFASATKVATIRIPITHDYTREHDVYFLQSFKGYH
ncbi:MAG: glycosyltransferase family 39 protein [Alphaproteobacteria bacterium]|nr:glycosyltransferase family 39 protein [Alphaproteobacteria bacterium]